VKRANKVFELGRDESSFLRISYGVVKYLNPNLFERYHYMFVQGADPQPEVQTVILRSNCSLPCYFRHCNFVSLFLSIVIGFEYFKYNFIVWQWWAADWLWWKNCGNGQWQHKRVVYTIFHFSQVPASMEEISVRFSSFSYVVVLLKYQYLLFFLFD
jgi:hypothetical protein